MKRYLTLLLVILLTAAFCATAFANAPAQSAQNTPSTQTAQDFSSKIAGMNKISNIRIGHTGDNIRIVVDGSQKIAYRSFSLSNPDRFAVDIQNAWLAQSAPRQIPIQGSKFVQQVRISQFDAKTVRIVVDATVLSDQVNILALPDPHRLVMDFGNVNKPPANIQKELERVQQTIEAEKKGAEQAKKEPAKQSSNPFEIDFEIIDDLPHGTIIYPPDTKEKDKPKKHAKPGLRGKTIVVDAGHGGSDCGAVGPNGLLEKDVTLKVALRLEKYLTEAGVKVLMTRKKDADVAYAYATTNEELQARVDVGNKNNADLFLSIHIDSFVNPEANGTSVYIYDDTYLGKCLHDELIDRLGRKDRGVKFANFYVLRNTAMPASLVELMFISNEEEEAILREEDTIEQAARALYEGLRTYFL
jgi:N-acetylmuramoyl-L-alanine amidase